VQIFVALFERLHRILRRADLHLDEVVLNTRRLSGSEKTVPVNISLPKFQGAPRMTGFSIFDVKRTEPARIAFELLDWIVPRRDCSSEVHL